MAFKVIRNERQANVEIQGANKPNYFLGTLTAVAGNSDTTLHIRNDARTSDSSDPQYEFFDVPHTQFNNASGKYPSLLYCITSIAPSLLDSFFP